MFVVKVSGGLGNQLFEYSFGRSLSLDLDTDFYIDLVLGENSFPKKHCLIRPIRKVADPLSKFACSHSDSLNKNFDIDLSDCELKNNSIVNYGLKHFNIKENIYHNEYGKKINKYNFMSEEDFPKFFPPNELIKNTEFPAYFDGHWQSENYFIHNEDLIREDLTFKTHPTGKNKEISEDIQSNNSVAVHIRRGDYLKNPSMGLCSKEYYNKAMRYIEKNIKKPKYFIFSNDPQWCQKNLKTEYPIYFVTNNSGDTDYEDLRLMSLCDYFIIANSSFSWWGAWLSQNKNKIIVKPTPWFFARSLEISNIKSKDCHKIKNDYSQPFKESDKILFHLNLNEYEKYLNYNKKELDIELNDKKLNLKPIQNINGLNMTFNGQNLNLKSLKNKPKIFLKNISKINTTTNGAILNMKLSTTAKDKIQLYYLTTDDKYYSYRKSFPVEFHENEQLDLYFPLSKDILLNELMFVPSKNNATKLNLISLELKEIEYNF